MSHEPSHSPSNFGFAPTNHGRAANRRGPFLDSDSSRSPSPMTLTPNHGHTTPLAPYGRSASPQLFPARTPSPMPVARISSPHQPANFVYGDPGSASSETPPPYPLYLNNSPGCLLNSRSGSPMQISSPWPPHFPPRTPTPLQHLGLGSQSPNVFNPNFGSPLAGSEHHEWQAFFHGSPGYAPHSPLFEPTRSTPASPLSSSHNPLQHVQDWNHQHNLLPGPAYAQHATGPVTPVANMLPSDVARMRSQEISHHSASPLEPRSANVFDRLKVREFNAKLQLVLGERRTTVQRKREELLHMAKDDQQLETALVDYGSYFFQSIAYYLEYRNDEGRSILEKTFITALIDMQKLFSQKYTKRTGGPRGAKPAMDASETLSEASLNKFLRSLPLCRSLFDTLTGEIGSFDKLRENSSRFDCMACHFSARVTGKVQTEAVLILALADHQGKSTRSRLREGDRAVAVPLNLQSHVGPFVHPQCWRFYCGKLEPPLDLDGLKQQGLVPSTDIGSRLFARGNAPKQCPGCERYFLPTFGNTDHFMHCNTGYCATAMLNHAYGIQSTAGNLPQKCDCQHRFPANKIIGYEARVQPCNLCGMNLDYNSYDCKKHRDRRQAADMPDSTNWQAPSEVQALDSKNVDVRTGRMKISAVCLRRLLLQNLPRLVPVTDRAQRAPPFDMELPISKTRLNSGKIKLLASCREFVGGQMDVPTQHDIAVVLLKCSRKAQAEEHVRLTRPDHQITHSALDLYAARYRLQLPLDSWWQNHTDAETLE